MGTGAENGKEAVAAFQEGAFDLVLMDVQMPEMNGFEATRHIRGREEATHVPIVAMTAHATEQDRDKCLEAGMDDYLPKPVEMETLRETGRTSDGLVCSDGSPGPNRLTRR